MVTNALVAKFIRNRRRAEAGGSVRKISRVAWVGLATNILLAAIKAGGGLVSGSTALVADAVHTLSDIATDAAVLVGVRYWQAPPDAEHPHGHRRIETAVALLIGVVLAVVGLQMGVSAVRTLVAGTRASVDWGSLSVLPAALFAVVASLVGKELLFRWTAAKGRELDSAALLANAWHHRSDALSSVPPIVSILGTMAGNRVGFDFWFLDPLATIAVCVLLLQASWQVVAPTLSVLFDTSADRELCSAICKVIHATPGVIGAHRVRTRMVGPNAVEVDMHLTVDKDLRVWQGHAVAARVKNRLLHVESPSRARVVEVMVHVEPADPVFEAARRRTSVDTMVVWKT